MLRSSLLTLVVAKSMLRPIESEGHIVLRAGL